MNRVMSAVCVLACFLACGLASPFAASASEHGVYVAPRFVYGITDFSNLKANFDAVNSRDSSSRSKHKHDETFGGALALGLNFKPHFDLPLRAEVEYAFFSESDPRSDFSSHRVLGGNVSGYQDYSHSVRQKVNVQTLFFNFYYDIETETRFTPFVSAGLGMAFVKSKTSYGGRNEFLMELPGGTVISHDRKLDGGGSSKSATNFAWNVGAGVGIELAQDLSLDVAYRFAHLGKVKSKNFDVWNDQGLPQFEGSLSSKTQDLYMHQFMAGLRWEFW